MTNALSFPKGGLVLEWHNDATEEWGTLSARAIIPSAISYEPKIKNSKVQGERNGAGARVATGEQEGEHQDGKEGATGHATMPDE